jgi:hypothetical protein
MKFVSIHPAPTNRTNCRFCGDPIKKGELRMQVQDTDFTFADGNPLDSAPSDWYHLPHAADQKPRQFIRYVNKHPETVPDREELMLRAQTVVNELDTFMKDPRWKTNDRGNRIMRAASWRLTVFTKESRSNWIIAGRPGDAFVALSGGEGAATSGPSEGTPEDTFGPGSFESLEEATDDLWLFLRRSGGAANG